MLNWLHYLGFECAPKPEVMLLHLWAAVPMWILELNQSSFDHVQANH